MQAQFEIVNGVLLFLFFSGDAYEPQLHNYLPWDRPLRLSNASMDKPPLRNAMATFNIRAATEHNKHQEFNVPK